MPATRGLALLRQRVDDFLVYCTARNFSPNTIRAYRSELAEFLALGNSRINRKLIRRFVLTLHKKGLKPASIRCKIAALKSFCTWLEDEGLLDGSIVASFNPARRKDTLPDVPNEAEVKRLFDGDIPTACPERDLVILELLYGSGLRVAELVGINLEDFREKDLVLVRGKGRKERLVIMSECARAAITRWLPVRSKLLRGFQIKTPALLFAIGRRRSAERLDVRSVGRVLKDVALARGLDPAKWHPHLLRHACATHMHDHNAPLQAIASLLGHAKLSTAQIYTRVSIGRMMDTYSRSHPHAVGMGAEGHPAPTDTN